MATVGSTQRRKFSKCLKFTKTNTYICFNTSLAYSDFVNFSNICHFLPASWSVDQSSSWRKVISRYMGTFPNLNYTKLMELQMLYWTIDFLLNNFVKLFWFIWFCYFYLHIWWFFCRPAETPWVADRFPSWNIFF